MVGLSQKQQLDAMPDGMAKRIILKILNAPKAPMDYLEENSRKYMEFLKKTGES